MTTTTDLAANGTAGIALARLDPYAGGVTTEDPRVDALGIISCGYRSEAARGSDRPGLPRASRPTDPQQIHLHDPQERAPGLARAIAEGEHKRLLITFPLDDPRQFIIQRFTRYSASRLEAYGDETAITWIEQGSGDTPPSHRRFPAGTREYERLVKTCKADTRIFFCLAEWGANGPEVVFPDGLGMYAIRTTSRHSVRSILGSLAYTAKFTRGRIAGLPFLLTVDHREVAGPDGSKRNIPVWTITTKPPEGGRLSSRTFRDIATTALKEGASLMLPSPSEPELADFADEGPADIDELSTQELSQLASGGLCDYNFYVKAWHAMARGSLWDNDQARASFIAAYTKDRTASLAEFLRFASEEEASGLVAALGEAVTNERRQRNNAAYIRAYGSEESSTIYDLPERAGEPQSQATAQSSRASGDYPPSDARDSELVTVKTDVDWKEWLDTEKRARVAGLDADTSRVKLGISRKELRQNIETISTALKDHAAEVPF